jgi:hypothetical protein
VLESGLLQRRLGLVQRRIADEFLVVCFFPMAIVDLDHFDRADLELRKSLINERLRGANRIASLRMCCRGEELDRTLQTKRGAGSSCRYDETATGKVVHQCVLP